MLVPPEVVVESSVPPSEELSSDEDPAVGAVVLVEFVELPDGAVELPGPAESEVELDVAVADGSSVAAPLSSPQAESERTRRIPARLGSEGG